MKFKVALLSFLALVFIAPSCFSGSSTDKAFTDNIRRSDGLVTVTVRDYKTDVALGLIADESDGGKFGENIEVDSGVVADVWDGGHTVASGGVSLIWVAPTQARVHQLVSSSTSDDGDPAGVGARTVRVYYLKDWDTPEMAIDVVMDGTTNVALPSCVIINRMKVLTKGATNVNVGIIKATADTDSTITSQIRAGLGQTQQCIKGISSLDALVMDGMDTSINKAGGAAGLLDLALLYNPEPDAQLTNFLTKKTYGLQTVGSSEASHSFGFNGLLIGPGIAKLQSSSGTNDMDVSAGWSGVIKTDISGFTVLMTQGGKMLTTQNSYALITQ